MTPETITIRCSCGEAIEEPVEGLDQRPVSQFNAIGHGSCLLPSDLADQIHVALTRLAVS